MFDVDWKKFFTGFDFDALMESFTTGSWKWVLNDPVVWVIAGILLAGMAVKKTRVPATNLTTWLMVAVFYGVGGVALKNSQISQPGPFILLIAMFFLAVGWYAYTKLLKG